MESCLVKSILAGGMGFALGGAFGLFISSVRLSCVPSIVPLRVFDDLRQPSPISPGSLDLAP